MKLSEEIRCSKGYSCCDVDELANRVAQLEEELLATKKVAFEVFDRNKKIAQLEEENEALEENRIDLCVMLKEWQSLIHPSRLTDLNYETNDLLDRNKSGTDALLTDTQDGEL